MYLRYTLAEKKKLNLKFFVNDMYGLNPNESVRIRMIYRNQESL